VLGVAACVLPLAAQAAPAGEPSPRIAASEWHERGRRLLEHEDPVTAWQAFRELLRLVDDETASAGMRLDGELGVGRVHLMLGHSAFALAYAESALASSPARVDAMALCVRALIRDRQFDEAVDRAAFFLARVGRQDAELLAARGSALFRVQRIEDAAEVYRAVTALDPLSAEAHLRLGSGLLPPSTVVIGRELERAVAALSAGERRRAIALLRAVLATSPEHPVAHRLLGEALYAERAAASMASNDPVFVTLAEAVPPPHVDRSLVAQFVPGYRHLSVDRRHVVDRTAALFAKKLGKVVAAGGRHDLLLELERTTDANERKSLRGRRTFDGRVWDDVRGVGGLVAATGIEALDEAASFGFDTFAHEVAHQVHFFAFTPLQRARIRALYKQAMAQNRCLDFYAASNEAEYFGQGVEAFVSLAKRPGAETTHGHTRFELLRLDPDLHTFVAELVDHDPLAAPGRREHVLAAAIAVALRCGRLDDAETALSMMMPGPRRDELRQAWVAAARQFRAF
jgi:hypothetical protein